MKLRIDRQVSNDFKTCKICNTLLNSLTALSAHVFKKHNLKSKDYFDLYLKTETDGTCLKCGNPTTYRNYYYHRFCSNKCADDYNYMNEEYRQKHKNSYNEETRKKMSNSKIEYFELEENRIKLSNTVKNYFKNPKNREKTSIAVTNSIKSGKIKRHYKYDNKLFQSYYELAFYIWLKDHKINFEYLQNYSIPYDYENVTYHYFPDFKVYNTLVEIKGLQFFENNNPNGKMINPYDRSKDGKYEAKYQCMIKHKVHIITNCKKYIKYVETKYGKNFKNQFKV